MPVRNVMVVMTATDHVLVVKPEIQRVEDLKGKILGGQLDKIDAGFGDASCAGEAQP